MKSTFIALIVYFLCNYSFAQTTDSDVLFSKNIVGLSTTTSLKMDSVQTLNPFLGLLKFYKGYISEQISADCAFNPSCSVFSYSCIKNIGLLRGVLLTADRLSRCHEDAYLHYPTKYIYNNDILDSYEMYR